IDPGDRFSITELLVVFKYFVKLTIHAVSGCDVAGIIFEVGEGMSKFKKGDEVYDDIQDFPGRKPKQYDTLARYTTVEEHLLALKPSNLSFEEST
ncbi:hypothetical protein KI387_000630, partial [Taxus chinensis]